MSTVKIVVGIEDVDYSDPEQVAQLTAALSELAAGVQRAVEAVSPRYAILRHLARGLHVDQVLDLDPSVGGGEGRVEATLKGLPDDATALGGGELQALIAGVAGEVGQVDKHEDWTSTSRLVVTLGA